MAAMARPGRRELAIIGSSVRRRPHHITDAPSEIHRFRNFGN
jgi:hypothetical protein